MATITLTIADAALPRVIDALCATGGRDEDSPAPKGQFAKDVLIDWVRSQVVLHETQQAAETARLAAYARARAEVLEVIT
jgi:hypothetical protein